VPAGLEAVLDRSTWALPAAVRLMEEHGVPREESERAFNCGIGMIAAVAPDAADAAVAQLTAAGVPSWVAGAIRAIDGPGATARLERGYR
jgi:phosphoribosylformylglycinamidine cyclo-ligase